MIKLQRTWWPLSVIVVIVAASTAMMLRYAHNADDVRISFASELDQSDPRYEQVMCGPVSLSTALGLLGTICMPESVASECKVTSQGVALSDLERFATKFPAVTAHSVVFDWERLLRKQCVAVLFVDKQHFLVVDTRGASLDFPNNAKIKIYEQGRPSFWTHRAELEKRWNGMALVLEREVLPTPHGPQIQWDQCYIDHGMLNNHHTEYHFGLRNVGDSDLLIDSVHLSCGCADYTLTRNRLSRGESALLKITINLEGKSGYMYQTARVHTNDLTIPDSVLTMAGGVPRKRVVSCDAIRLEDLPQGGNISKDLYIFDPGFTGFSVRSATFSITNDDLAKSISCSIKHQQIESSSRVLDLPPDSYTNRDSRVSVTFAASPACPITSFKGEIVIAIDVDGITTAHKVSVFGTVVQDVYSIPRVPLIALRSDSAGLGVTTIQLHSYTNRKFTIVKSWTHDAHAVVVSPVATSPTGNIAFAISVRMPLLAVSKPPFNTTISFQLDDGSIISIPLVIYAMPSLASVNQNK